MTNIHEVNNAKFSTMQFENTYRHPIIAVLRPATDWEGQTIDVSFTNGDEYVYFPNKYSWDYSLSTSENYAKAVKAAIEKYDEQNGGDYHKWHYLQMSLPCGSQLFAHSHRNNN